MAAGGSLNALHKPSLQFRCRHCGAKPYEYCCTGKGKIMKTKMHHERLVGYTGHSLFGARV